MSPLVWLVILIGHILSTLQSKGSVFSGRRWHHPEALQHFLHKVQNPIKYYQVYQEDRENIKRDTHTDKHREMINLFVFPDMGSKVFVINIFKKVDEKVENLTRGLE